MQDQDSSSYLDANVDVLEYGVNLVAHLTVASLG